MLRPIVLVDELARRHPACPSTWKQIIKAINSDCPGMALTHFGKVILLEGQLCLVIDKELLKGYTPINPLPDREVIIATLVNSIANSKAFTRFERYCIDLVSDLLISWLPCHIYEHRIDLAELGRLTITNSTIAYSNQKISWDYQLHQPKFCLPELSSAINHAHLTHSESISKMERKFSLSLQKNKEDSSAKKLHRSRSFIKLPINQQNQKGLQKRMQTETFSSQSKLLQLKKPTKYLTLKTENTEMEKGTSTEGEKMWKLRTNSPSRKSSGQKSSCEQQKKTLCNLNLKEKERQLRQTNKKVLHLNERKMIPFEQNEGVRELKVVEDMLQKLTNEPIRLVLHRFPDKKASTLDFIRELSHIFLLQSSFAKRKIYHQDLPKSIKPYQTQKINLSLLTQQEQNIFYTFYEKWIQDSMKIKAFTNTFLVDFDQAKYILESWLINLEGKMHEIENHRGVMIKVGILMREYLDLMIREWEKICSKAKQGRCMLMLRLSGEASFQADLQQLTIQFLHMFTLFTNFLASKFPSFLRIQQHEMEAVKSISVNIQSHFLSQKELIFSSGLQTIQAHLQSFTTPIFYFDPLLNHKYISNLQLLIQNIQAFHLNNNLVGVIVDISKLKQFYLEQLNCNLRIMSSTYLELHQKYVAELNLIIRSTKAMSSQFLYDYRSEGHKQAIRDCYQKIHRNFFFLFNNFPNTVDFQRILRYLSALDRSKQEVQQYLLEFDCKLKEFKLISKKNVELLDYKSKESKAKLKQISMGLKRVLGEITSERSLMEHEDEIGGLERKFVGQKGENALIVEAMKEHDMICWEEDTFFEDSMALLKKCLLFLKSKSFRLIFLTHLTDIASFQDFTSAFNAYSQFIQQIQATKLEKCFKNNYTLVSTHSQLAQIFLYKHFSEQDLLDFQNAGLNFIREESLKIFQAIKKADVLSKNNLEKIMEKHYEVKLRQFVNLEKARKDKLNVEGLLRFEGEELIKQVDLLVEGSEVGGEVHEQLIEIRKTWVQLLRLQKILEAINGISIDKKQAHKDLRLEFNSYLSSNHDINRLLQLSLKIKLQRQNYSQILFKDKINSFPRLAFLSIDQLLDCCDWTSKESIFKNVKVLYQHVDDVQLDQNLDVLTIFLGKDNLVLDKFNLVVEGDADTSKAFTLYVESYLKNSLHDSKIVTCQIKILNWMISFTQQVEYSLLTGTPISKLKLNFLELIKEIHSELRYDIKQHHKIYQIAQLNFFISYIQKNCNLQSQDSFQWQSTLKVSEKNKSVKVSQNNRSYNYGFQLKKPMNFDPSFQLETTVSYGFSSTCKYYEVSSYILGQPFFEIESFTNSGWRENFTGLINIIKKFNFFLKIKMSDTNLNNLNFLHKQILILQSNAMGSIENQNNKMELPIIFEYGSEEAVPKCFSMRSRNEATESICFSLNLIILLRTNRFQGRLTKYRIRPNMILKILNAINTVADLTVSDIIQILAGIETFLNKDSLRIKEIEDFMSKIILEHFRIDQIELQVMIRESLQAAMQPLDLQCDCDIEREREIVGLIQQMKDGRMTQHLVLYGDTSCKTHLLKKSQIPFYSPCSADSLVFVEGLAFFLDLPFPTQLFIIEATTIHQIQPQLLTTAKLFFVNVLSVLTVENIFQMKVDALFGDRISSGFKKVIWKGLNEMYSIYEQVSGQFSLLMMIDLCWRNFIKHLEVKANEDEEQSLVLNRETTKIFLLVLNEMMFYGLGTGQRKKFNLLMRESSIFVQFKGDDLSSLTLVGRNIEKVVALVKKEKWEEQPVNYVREMILIRKYLMMHEHVHLSCENYVIQKVVKAHCPAFLTDSINLTTHPNHLKLLHLPTNRFLVYIIEDLHLINRATTVSIKSHLDHSKLKSQALLFLSLPFKSEPSTQALLKNKRLCFKFDEIQLEEVFKTQIKCGISENIVAKSKLLYEGNFFTNKLEFLEFILGTTMKLPAQYFKKYYPRQLVLLKLNLNSPVLEITNQWEASLKVKVEMNSEKVMLTERKGIHQEINELAANTIIQKQMPVFSHMQKLVIREHYKAILPYCLANKTYVVKQDLHIFPLLISYLSETPIYSISEHDFMSKIVDVLKDLSSSPKNFIIVFTEPLSTSKAAIDFIELILKGADLFSIYSQLNKYVHRESKRIEFVYNRINQKQVIKQQINHLLFEKMKIIVSLKKYSNLQREIAQELKNQIICVNVCLPPSLKQQLIKNLLAKSEKKMNNLNQNILRLFQKLKPALEKQIIDSNIELDRMEYLIDEIVQAFIEWDLLCNQKKEKSIETMKLYERCKDMKGQVLTAVEQDEKALAEVEKVKEQFAMKMKGQEETKEKEISIKDHYEEIIGLREAFFSKDRSTDYEGQDLLLNRPLIKWLQQEGLLQCLQVVDQYIHLAFNHQLLLQFAIKKELQSKWQNIHENQFAKTILWDYLDYVIMFTTIYQRQGIEDFDLLVKQCKRINYFYHIDMNVHIKKLHQKQQDLIQKKRSQIESIQIFQQTFALVQDIFTHKDQSNICLILNKLRNIFRNQIFAESPKQKFELQFETQISSDCFLSEDSLEFEESNANLLTHRKGFLVYDPNEFFISICNNLGMEIVFITDEANEELKCYRFKPTIYCIQIPSLQYFFNHKQSIANCLKTFETKNSDLLENQLEKIALIIGHPEILSEMNFKLTQINLHYNFNTFSDKISTNSSQQLAEKHLKNQLISLKNELKHQIEIIKNVKADFVSYIVHTSTFCSKFMKKRTEIIKFLEKKKQFKLHLNQESILKLYESLKLMHSDNFFPFNYFLRVESKINIEVLLQKIEKSESWYKSWKSMKSLKSCESSSEKMRQVIKHYLLSLKSGQVRAELEECLSVSRYVTVVYEQFNKRIIKDISFLEEKHGICIRLIIEVNQEILIQLFNQRLNLAFKGKVPMNSIVILIHQSELIRLKTIINQCAVLWL